MMNYSIYHDESECHTSNFLYHGYIFIHDNFREEILNDLSEIRDRIWKNKRVHFKEFKNDSTKAKLGKAWIDYSIKKMEEGKIMFYLFGINKPNLGNFWNNGKSFEANVYERFFEIGLNGSIGWFSKKNMNPNGFNISDIFYELGDYNEGRSEKVVNTFFRNYNSASINLKNSPKGLSGCHIESNDINSIGLQLTDLFLGSCRIAYSKNNKRSNIECADKLKNIILKFSSTKAYNPNSKLYKRFSVTFFPSENTLSKSDFLNKAISIDRGNFYNERKTFWCIERENSGFEKMSLF